VETFDPIAGSVVMLGIDVLVDADSLIESGAIDSRAFFGLLVRGDRISVLDTRASNPDQGLHGDDVELNGGP
jgi:hypothetical protein